MANKLWNLQSGHRDASYGDWKSRFDSIAEDLFTDGAERVRALRIDGGKLVLSVTRDGRRETVTLTE